MQIVCEAGLLEGRLVAPYIYFIIIKSFLYVGETQKLPFIRWTEHISVGGSLFQKLQSHESTGLLHEAPLKFGWLLCEEVLRGCSAEDRRRGVQWVEDEIHMKIAESGAVSSRYQLISNTLRTSPRRYRGNDLLKQLVDRAFQTIIRSLDIPQVQNDSSGA